MLAIHILISLMPVVFFLAGLVLIDSYKLVRFRAVGSALAAGLLSAGAAWFVNTGLLDILPVDHQTFTRYVAPLSEEALKALWIVFIITSDRVGFSVDAAILGFAVGAGFGVLENIYYLGALDAGTQTWVIRGFGTAIMHGVATTVFSVVLRTVAHDSKRSRWLGGLLAFVLAAALHSIYNHFPFSPLVSTAILIIMAPLLVMVLFHQSERQTRSWLGTGFDTDQELMTLLMSGNFGASRIGQYLSSLREHFEGPIVADMLCLIRIRVELSIRAKGLLMMREAGFTPPPDESVKAKFRELEYLEASIGRAGMMAIDPIQRWSSKELWQLNMLSDG
ncbi:MAG: PrsW family glutamic-type intramembrane protease [Bacteroidetes bacterium]|nr:PrsW family glutamic-type intramembrane protease [Bacteroidota bacterium]